MNDWKVLLEGDVLKDAPPADFGLPFPEGAWVLQKTRVAAMGDVGKAVRERLSRAEVRERIRPGMRIAVGVGSRGIGRLDEIVRAAVALLREWGARPFIVPAMGSHGGAVPEGQREVLAAYGITEESMGVPIDDSMEASKLGRTPGGLDVFFSRAAEAADAVLPVCRVKPHTTFRGPFESGVLKMLAIGFGKHEGAAALHQAGFDRFAELIPEAGRLILSRIAMAAALAVVENADDEPALLEALLPEEVREREPQLLEKAREWMGRLPFRRLDLLVVDEMGKNISGTGMDPNVTGRFSQSFMRGGPDIQKLVVLDLTEASHGNASGIGAADVTTRALLEKIDFRKTYTNCIASTVLSSCRLPVVMPDAESAVAVGLGTCNRVSPAEAGVVRIRNTLELKRIWISQSLLQEARQRSDLEILEAAAPLLS